MSPRCLWVLSLLAGGTVSAATESLELLACSHPGQRQTVLVLADHGASSYVKFGTQRIAASRSVEDDARRWRWSSGSVLLKSDGFADYFEGAQAAEVKARFRCRAMGR